MIKSTNLNTLIPDGSGNYACPGTFYNPGNHNAHEDVATRARSLHALRSIWRRQLRHPDAHTDVSHLQFLLTETNGLAHKLATEAHLPERFGR